MDRNAAAIRIFRSLVIALLRTWEDRQLSVHVRLTDGVGEAFSGSDGGLNQFGTYRWFDWLLPAIVPRRQRRAACHGTPQKRVVSHTALCVSFVVSPVAMTFDSTLVTSTCDTSIPTSGCWDARYAISRSSFETRVLKPKSLRLILAIRTVLPVL